MINLPVERLGDLRASPTIQLAVTAGLMFRVQSYQELHQRVALPCDSALFRKSKTDRSLRPCTRKNIIKALRAQAAAASKASDLSDAWLLSHMPYVGRRGYKRTQPFPHSVTPAPLLSGRL